VSEESGPHEPDFIDKALESFDHVLDVFHDRVLRPLLLAGRVVAYGFIILLASLVLVVALIIGLLRLLDVYLFAGHVWISYLIVGAASLVGGLIIWRRRRPVPVRKS
jgi:hypothetical protein